MADEHEGRNFRGTSPTTAGLRLSPISSRRHRSSTGWSSIASRSDMGIVWCAMQGVATRAKSSEEIGAAETRHGDITRAVLRLLMQYAVDAELRHDNRVAGLKA